MRWAVVCMSAWGLLLTPLAAGQPLPAQGSPPVPLAAPEPAALPVDRPPEPGAQPSFATLAVRVGLPPGVAGASLFLNEWPVAELPGGVLLAPLTLQPGGYQIRVSSPGLRSYVENLSLAPGEFREIYGALIPEAAPVAPVLTVAPPPPPPALRLAKARSLGRKIGLAIGITAGITLTVGLIVVVAVAASGKGGGSGSHHFDD